ncbi:MAG: hypothetical protein HC887_11030 [Desulfobacteraceae bacterium]|nr:hypothetical protein [Desulfobacteraceae bacterium]
MKTTDFFKRGKPIAEIGYERELSELAFNLSSSKKVPDNPIKGNAGYYVIEFREKKEPDAEGFDKEKENIRKRLLQQKQAKAFENWLTLVKSKSRIVIEKEFTE